MLLEVALPGERFPARVAGKLLHSSVDFYMSVKITFSGELLLTQLALILMLLGVNGCVLLQLPFAVEQLLAVVAAEHCHSSVRQ